MVIEPVGTRAGTGGGYAVPLMLETWIDCVETAFVITLPTGAGAVGGYVWIEASLGDVTRLSHTVRVEKNCDVPARDPEFCPKKVAILFSPRV